MTPTWKDFWIKYRNLEARNEDDLFVQVGKTVKQQPISRATFQRMVERIVALLQLTQGDYLMDFCCGNGLVTYELAPSVSRVMAVDFAEHLVTTARQMKSHANISYHVGEVAGFLEACTLQQPKPSKFLMNDSLAYFDPDELRKIVLNIQLCLANLPFRFLITGIPNSELKSNFYNTPERRARQQHNEKSSDNTNDGLGRWWNAKEILLICEQCGLEVQIENQPAEISNYRMDALIFARS